MNMENLTSLISQMGFPIFVALWYMFKQSTDTKNMTEALNRLTEAINLIKAQMGTKE